MSVMAERVSDGELLRRVGDGDGGAFETLYRRYSRPAVSYTHLRAHET